jgi:hypothetical protein
MGLSERIGNRVILSIGDIGYELSAQDVDVTTILDPEYIPFVGGSTVDVSLDIRVDCPNDLDLGPVLFDSGGVWVLHAANGEQIYGFRAAETSPSGGHAFSHIMRLDRALTSGRICVQTPTDRRPRHGRAFGHASSEVLTVAMLSRGRGVELHGLGLGSSGAGYLFCGVSGAGKSTVGRIWCREPEVEILSDDRIIVRKMDGGFCIYGTPWHGDAGFASPGSAPLERLFFLRQGSTNSIRPLSSGEATAKLMTCCFATFWDPEGMAFTLSFLDEMATSVPCYELTFVKDRSMVDFVRQL